MPSGTQWSPRRKEEQQQPSARVRGPPEQTVGQLRARHALCEDGRPPHPDTRPKASPVLGPRYSRRARATQGPGAPGPLPVSRGPGAARREGPLVSGKRESWGINKYQGPCGESKAPKNDPTRLLQTPGLTPSYAVVDLIINCIPETPRSKTSAAIQDSHWPRWHV